MAIVTYVLGDCPKCGAASSFGNVDVYRTYVYRGCKRCRHSERVHLPAVRKRILYLDQFFFSHAFRGGEPRFLDAAARIARLTAYQLLAVPFSSVHEDETHQWERHDELHEFIKRTARGEEFEPAYDIERAQLVKAFREWLKGSPTQYPIDFNEAFSDEINGWDGYMRIDVGRYMGDIDLIRDLKRRSIDGLVDLFDGWRQLTSSFDDDLQAEYAEAGRSYMDFYLNYVMRIGRGDVNALIDSPIVSLVVQTMLHVIPRDVPSDQRIRKCAEFLVSDHFKESPYQWLNAHILATLKAMVKNGAYTNRERAIQRLSGFFYDVKHIASYAPYVDAFVMDQPMAELVARPTVALEQRYGVKVFSLTNWDELFTWFDVLEAAGMTEGHKAGLTAAYPGLRF